MWELTGVKELKEALNAREPIRLVDLREQADFDAGHISGAVRMSEKMLSVYCSGQNGRPLSERDGHAQRADGPGYTEVEHRLFLICYYGPGSIRAARRISGCGYPGMVLAVSGGMDAWQQAGYPVTASGAE